MSNLSQAAFNAGLELEDLHDLGNDEKSQSHIAALIESIKKSKVVNLDADLDVLVNYGEMLEEKMERLEKLGFTFSNENITSANFPVPEGRSGTVQMRLALPKLTSTVSTDTAKKFVGKCNLEVGDLYQLLDLIEQNWDRLQAQMTAGLYVAAQTTSWQNPGGSHYVICLDCHGSRVLGSRSVPLNP
jgi:hypothetical protein